jgi:hypothetical protein
MISEENRARCLRALVNMSAKGFTKVDYFRLWDDIKDYVSKLDMDNLLEEFEKRELIIRSDKYLIEVSKNTVNAL